MISLKMKVTYLSNIKINYSFNHNKSKVILIDFGIFDFNNTNRTLIYFIIN